MLRRGQNHLRSDKGPDGGKVGNCRPRPRDAACRGLRPACAHRPGRGDVGSGPAFRGTKMIGLFRIARTHRFVRADGRVGGGLGLDLGVQLGSEQDDEG